ncbi:two-component response regulator DpiA [Brenneria corticis]|uniref:Transcriptional regulatory protein n=1 Tax=Brenneria corticis TaxID=2173106 RepID=A0A2U1U897_9GAMM|nr:two-component response regulator DpiA [Brenneria sp. CFCC 11842]PWC17890.1 response regulator [Brenneria sp. CFCC 11842]
MTKINILIVEDETPLAEMHVEFIRQHRECGQIWLAGNLSQARTMVDRFNPDLILLDNFLPDGQGLSLLRELTLNHFAGGVVLITADSDMDTVAEAIRCGVFDYLIKPIAYERLSQTLERFWHRLGMFNQHNGISQSQIDDMYNAYARGKPKEKLPANIDELTLNKVQSLFHEEQTRHTAETVALQLGLSRTTARRYLEYCAARRMVEAEIIYGKVGRPQRIYRLIRPED